MIICPNCKTAIDDQSTFCRSCGTRIERATEPEQKLISRVRCPKCGEQSALDSSVVTAGKNTRSYWTCRVCKTRFRDIDDLEKELKNNNPKMMAIGTLIGMLGGFFPIAVGLFFNWVYQNMDYWTRQQNSALRVVALLFALAGIAEIAVFFILYLKKIQDWRQLQQEQAELK